MTQPIFLLHDGARFSKNRLRFPVGQGKHKLVQHYLEELHPHKMKFTRDPGRADYIIVPDGLRVDDLGQKIIQRAPWLQYKMIPFSRFVPQKKHEEAYPGAVLMSRGGGLNIHVPENLRPAGYSSFLDPSYVQQLENVNIIPLEKSKVPESKIVYSDVPEPHILNYNELMHGQSITAPIVSPPITITAPPTLLSYNQLMTKPLSNFPSIGSSSERLTNILNEGQQILTAIQSNPSYTPLSSQKTEAQKTEMHYAQTIGKYTETTKEAIDQLTHTLLIATNQKNVTTQDFLQNIKSELSVLQPMDYNIDMYMHALIDLFRAISNLIYFLQKHLEAIGHETIPVVTKWNEINVDIDLIKLLTNRDGITDLQKTVQSLNVAPAFGDFKNYTVIITTKLYPLNKAIRNLLNYLHNLYVSYLKQMKQNLTDTKITTDCQEKYTNTIVCQKDDGEYVGMNVYNLMYALKAQVCQLFSKIEDLKLEPQSFIFHNVGQNADRLFQFSWYLRKDLMDRYVLYREKDSEYKSAPVDGNEFCRRVEEDINIILSVFSQIDQTFQNEHNLSSISIREDLDYTKSSLDTNPLINFIAFLQSFKDPKNNETIIFNVVSRIVLGLKPSNIDLSVVDIFRSKMELQKVINSLFVANSLRKQQLYAVIYLILWLFMLVSMANLLDSNKWDELFSNAQFTSIKPSMWQKIFKYFKKG